MIGDLPQPKGRPVENRDLTRDLLSRRNVLQEIWTHLPVWFLFIESWGILNIFMANAPQIWFDQLGISRTAFALLSLPISLWFYAYYRVRLRASTKSFDRRKVHRRVLAVAFGLPLLTWAWYTACPCCRYELSSAAFRRLFELSNLFWALAIMIHTILHRGVRGYVTFFVVAFFYGMILENSGIYFGFFYEPHFVGYVGKLPAPLATMVGWCIIFTCCITLIEYFREHSPRLAASPVLTALATTALALSADAQLDPLASFPNMFWHWNPALSPWWFGVPFCNYAAWCGAFFAFSWAYFTFRDRGDLTFWQKSGRLLVLTPSIAVLGGSIWLALMLVCETFGGPPGAHYPTLQILGAFLDKIRPYELP
jgi:hypothetical protein